MNVVTAVGQADVDKVESRQCDPDVRDLPFKSPVLGSIDGDGYAGVATDIQCFADSRRRNYRPGNLAFSEQLLALENLDCSRRSPAAIRREYVAQMMRSGS